MSKLAKFSIALITLITTGCASLGLKSVPWPTATGLYDRKAVTFLREVPASESSMGRDLHPKDMAADQALVGMAVSGGGARSTAFTLGVLAELQDMTTQGGENALERIDFVSANSGGSWGVATWLAQTARNNGAYVLSEHADQMRKQLVALSKDRVSCWNKALETVVPQDVTFGSLYKSQTGSKLPRVFFNAALLPAQSPFVFTDSFLGHFAVESITTCSNSAPQPARTLAELPIATAATISGSVPGFYYAFAQTGLCSPDSAMRSASFCAGTQTGNERSVLRLADGGLYDNIGYKTAFEVMQTSRGDTHYRHRGMIVISSNPTLDQKTIARTNAKSAYFKAIAANGVFAVQDSTFERLLRPMFAAAGAKDIVLLDFFSVAGFGGAQDEADIADLQYLAFYASRNVGCLNGTGGVIKGNRSKWPKPSDMPSAQESLDALKDKGGDCASENFYRTGTLGKTTYKFDPVLSQVMWELGRLVVRKNCAQILTAIGSQPGGSGRICRRASA